MRVQTLHPDPGPAHAPGGRDEIDAHDGLGATLRVLFVGARQMLRVDQLFEAVHAAAAFEATHGVAQVRVDEPEERWHGRTVTQVRFVFDHHRPAIVAAHDHRASSGERSAQQFFYRGEVVGRRVMKGAQRQNSRVCTNRATKPVDEPCFFTCAPAPLAASDETDEGDSSGWRPGSPVL